MIPLWLHFPHSLLPLHLETCISLLCLLCRTARTSNWAITQQGWNSAPGQRQTEASDPDHEFEGGGCRFSGGHPGTSR